VDVLGASKTSSVARVEFAETAARVEDARVFRERRIAARDGACIERGATAGGMIRVDRRCETRASECPSRGSRCSGEAQQSTARAGG
jgi:hypothetical protein